MNNAEEIIQRPEKECKKKFERHGLEREWLTVAQTSSMDRPTRGGLYRDSPASYHRFERLPHILHRLRPRIPRQGGGTDATKSLHHPNFVDTLRSPLVDDILTRYRRRHGGLPSRVEHPRRGLGVRPTWAQ